MQHSVYSAIVSAVKAGRLIEPFRSLEFRDACPGFGDGTYQAFLAKHSTGNPGGDPELFRRVARGKFECLRPFRYGL